MPRIPFSLIVFPTIIATALLQAHDSFEITIEIQEKRNSIEARLEMARSTAVAACDPAPSNGVLFEPEDFSLWEKRFLQAAPDLIQILNTEGELETKTTKTSLTREDDVRIEYVFIPGADAPSILKTPILSRFPPDGFGVRVTYRDKSGHWHPPFMVFADKQSSPLPPQ